MNDSQPLASFLSPDGSAGRGDQGEHGEHGDQGEHGDARVALIKSLATNNRFYALAPPDSSLRNAGTIEEIPHDLLLGIAYPCLEDGLNDFCVIRTAFETMDLFPDDQTTRAELREMIEDARRTLTRRLMELLERIIARKAHFLGLNLEQFKQRTLKIIQQGVSRYDMDAAMKVNVFSSVALTEQALEQNASPRYHYEFNNSETAERLLGLPGRDFLVALFADVLDSVLEEENYQNRYTFDKNIFQQFIALMFVSYSATDPIFYGTHKDDYGVSASKNMDDTPLYRAVKQELCRLADLPVEQSAKSSVNEEWESIALAEITARNEDQNEDQSVCHGALVPYQAEHNKPALEETILAPIAAICAVARQLQKHEQHHDLAQMLLSEATRLVQELKFKGVLSPLAYNPANNPGTTEENPTQSGH